tara:strand:+ start:11534 stop:13102 length:1569 start_codon:yes stop_codon:yes gene_type:complete
VSVNLNEGINIIVGDNETGKTTLLEAINLALTGRINSRPISFELQPFLFNKETSNQFIGDVSKGLKPAPPEILIELYLRGEEAELALLEGTNNSSGENCPGISLKLALDTSTFGATYEEYISRPDPEGRPKVQHIPTELYRPYWFDFSGEPMTLNNRIANSELIDPTSISNTRGAEKYVLENIRSLLGKQKQVDLALHFRDLNNTFISRNEIKEINAGLNENRGGISEKQVSIGIDTSSKASWETTLQPYLDDIPLPLVGKGEQSKLKIRLAIQAAESSPIILIEEPENHLSHTNLNKLIHQIQRSIGSKQLIATTHSSYVLNSLGLIKTIMFDGKKGISLTALPPDTERYFKKLPGFETLRMLLADKTILVEGPSDELIVEAAYIKLNGCLPIEDGVEVISVNSLAFKRFLDIAKVLNIRVRFMTDNDGKAQTKRQNYKSYTDRPNVELCMSDNDDLKTLEPQIADVNETKTLNKIFGKSFTSQTELLNYMNENKADCALKLAETSVEFNFPEYVQDAIKK